MQTPESRKARLLIGESLKAPRAARVKGKSAWHDLSERSGHVVAAANSEEGNSVGSSRGQHRTLDGWAVMDWAQRLSEMARKKEEEK
jgi:hypothetical protein